MRFVLLGPPMGKLVRGPLFLWQFYCFTFNMFYIICEIGLEKIHSTNAEKKIGLVLAINYKNKLQIHFSIHWSHESQRECSCTEHQLSDYTPSVFSFHVKNLTWSDKPMSFTGIVLAKCLLCLLFNQYFNFNSLPDDQIYHMQIYINVKYFILFWKSDFRRISRDL